MVYLKDENYINTFTINETQYVTAYANHVYATPRCFTVKQNTKGKYINAEVIAKYGNHERVNALYLTERQLGNEI